MPTVTTIGLECWCGLLIYPTQEHYNQNVRNGTKIFCPLGHSGSRWGDDPMQKLRDEATRLRAQVDRERADANHQRARVAALKGVVTKTKQRVGKGSCPCCHRHFENVERHMANKHPQYAESEVVT